MKIGLKKIRLQYYILKAHKYREGKLGNHFTGGNVTHYLRQSGKSAVNCGNAIEEHQNVGSYR